MYKKCKVAILATGNASKLFIRKDSNKLDQGTISTDKIHLSTTNQHLYILSDDEIKEGDWCCHNNITNDKYQIIQCTPSNKVSIQEHWKKIIATTDSSLIIRINHVGIREEDYMDLSLPSIPKLFIDSYVSEYNKGNKIEEVMVEYDEHYNTGLVDCGDPDLWDSGYSDYTLKLNPNNTIIIKTIKTSWTREEVIMLLNRATEYVAHYDRDEDMSFDEWIESNL